MLASRLLKDRFELLVAGRLLRSKRSTHLSLISVMSIAGIALGVAALIVVLAVNTGFQGAFQERILSTWPHMVAMRRGLDLRDWREVLQRVEKLSFVTRANPATYDDMMLSSANGRAGAVVRGVPAASLSGLPEGVVAQGELDLHGEAPRHEVDGGKIVVRSANAGARHVITVEKTAAGLSTSVASIVQPQGDLAGLVIIDRGGCGATPPKSGITLRYATSKEVVRHTARNCGVAAHWEVMPGAFELEVSGGNTPRIVRLILNGGTTGAVIVGRTAQTFLPGARELPQTAAGVAVIGVDGASAEIELSGQDDSHKSGPKWRAMTAELPSIALGEGLAKKLQVQIGDEVRAVSPLRDSGTDNNSSASGRFTVRTILRTGFYDHDQRLALVDFTAAQRFLGRGDVAHWIDVRIEDALLAKAKTPELKAALEPVTLEDMLGDVQRIRGKIARIQSEIVPGLLVRKPRHAVDLVDNWVSGFRASRQARTRSLSMFRVIDWEEMNRNIFDAARMQKVAMSLFPFIIVLVAALNVIGTQAVIVHERGRDIAILRAMGATRRSVGSIFLVQGLAVGLVGTAIGLVLGGLCCLLLEWVGYPLDPHVYLISELPVHIEMQTFVLAGGAATLLTFAAAWLAARRAAMRSPVQGLQRLD